MLWIGAQKLQVEELEGKTLASGYSIREHAPAACRGDEPPRGAHQGAVGKNFGDYKDQSRRQEIAKTC
jgi:hypothetical protein